ncbi:PBP1A family penicillin-binding protein [Albimonas sp. CAU 1670]|uniref:transglycosylase domain-containing protein n=1 Tax=Albimonas sp. CAU 1670 TaxID=3032599 RepID=UPI0023DC8210|nr:PBP1A family penicillin-binding protein [Albimonas sp. CAU 1670]MDF2231912.1 PBP1A family penicillin-binding protein [Albimonas sp. CAU 1670]
MTTAQRRAAQRKAERQPGAPAPAAKRAPATPKTATPKPAKAARAAKPRRERASGGRMGWLDRAVRSTLLFVARWTWLVGSRIALGVALVVAVSVGWYYFALPAASDLLDGRERGSVTLIDEAGEVFAWRGDQFGGALRAGEMSPHLVHGVVAAEDRRYYSHFGIDPLGLARAMAVNIRAGGLVQGGSTLTQQTAKNVFLTNERSLERKLKELPMALAMELKYTKEEILSIYLNRVYLGAGAYGFEAAAQRYFGKSAREVNPAEAAMLAGLLKAPSRYAPTNDLGAAQNRATVIVGLMEEQDYLTEAEAEYARAHPAELSQAASDRAGGAFADWVMEAGPAWLTRDTTEDVRIRTTFDRRAQLAAEAAVRSVFEENVKEGSDAQAAVVVMTPDGAVRAIVGGRNPTGLGGQFNRATQALRQTGSAFKPVVFAAALEAGASPNDIVRDEPITIKGWTPSNYNDERFGRMTLTQALARSVNTIAVRTAVETGLPKVRQMAADMGMTAELAPGPAIALGTSEATLLDMTGVYATIAHGGLKTEPWGIRSVTLRGENTPLMTHAPDDRGPRAMSAQTARRLTGMMEEVIRSGTGRRAQLDGREAAGKTGTTQAARDAWFIGFTADYVVGVWMGYDDNTPLTGVTGGGLPAEIWRRAMLGLHEGMPLRELDSERPSGASDAPSGERIASGNGGSRRNGARDVVESGLGAVGSFIAGVVDSLSSGGGGGGRSRDSGAESWNKNPNADR